MLPPTSKKSYPCHLKALVPPTFSYRSWYQDGDQLYHLKAVDAKPQMILNLMENSDWEACSVLADKIKDDALNIKDIIIVLVDKYGHMKGIAALLSEDITTYSNDGPFLSALYVSPAFRGQGLCLDLVTMIEKEAMKRNYHHLYALAYHSQLYERLDYHYVGHTSDDSGHSLKVFEKELGTVSSHVITKEKKCLI